MLGHIQNVIMMMDTVEERDRMMPILCVVFR